VTFYATIDAGIKKAAQSAAMDICVSRGIARTLVFVILVVLGVTEFLIEALVREDRFNAAELVAIPFFVFHCSCLLYR